MFRVRDKSKNKLCCYKRFNDDEVYDFIEMANYYPIDVRFIELMPLEKVNIFMRMDILIYLIL